jgi:hypothetical protein
MKNNTKVLSIFETFYGPKMPIIVTQRHEEKRREEKRREWKGNVMCNN